MFGHVWTKQVMVLGPCSSVMTHGCIQKIHGFLTEGQAFVNSRWLLYNMDYIYILTYIHTHTYIPTYLHTYIYIYVYTYIYIIRPDFLRLLWEMTDVHQLIISKKTTTHFTSHDFPIVEMITTVDYFTIILLLLFSSTPRLPTVPSNLKTIVVIVKNTNN